MWPWQRGPALQPVKDGQFLKGGGSHLETGGAARPDRVTRRPIAPAVHLAAHQRCHQDGQGQICSPGRARSARLYSHTVPLRVDENQFRFHVRCHRFQERRKPSPLGCNQTQRNRRVQGIHLLPAQLLRLAAGLGYPEDVLHVPALWLVLCQLLPPIAHRDRPCLQRRYRSALRRRQPLPVIAQLDARVTHPSLLDQPSVCWGKDMTIGRGCSL